MAIGGEEVGSLPGVEKEGEEPRTVSSCHHPELSSAAEPRLEKNTSFSLTCSSPLGVSQHQSARSRDNTSPSRNQLRAAKLQPVRPHFSVQHPLKMTKSAFFPSNCRQLNLFIPADLLVFSGSSSVCCQIRTSLFRQQEPSGPANIGLIGSKLSALHPPGVQHIYIS